MMWRIVQIWCALICLQAAVNGVVMLASPPTWYRLPRWLRVDVKLIEHGEDGRWRDRHLRVVGGALLAAVSVMLWVLFFRG